MAEHSGLRSIAVIRRVTGVRAGHRMRLAVLRRPRLMGASRFTAAIAARTGLGSRVARHSLGFSQSLRPLRRRRSMFPTGLSFILRRRRPRRSPEQTRPALVWPRSQRPADESSASLQAVSRDDAIDQPMAQPLQDVFEDSGFEDAHGDDVESEPFTGIPAETIFARHEAFLGLPLRQSSIAAPVPPARESSGLSLPLARRTLAIAADLLQKGEEPGIGDVESDLHDVHSPVATRSMAAIPAASEHGGRFDVSSMSGAWQGVAIPSHVDVGPTAPLLVRARGGLHALRRIGNLESHETPGPTVGLSAAVAAKHSLAFVGSSAEVGRAYRAAPITLPLTRPFTLARAAAILRAAGAGRQAALVWPARSEPARMARVATSAAESSVTYPDEPAQAARPGMPFQATAIADEPALLGAPHESVPSDVSSWSAAVSDSGRDAVLLGWPGRVGASSVGAVGRAVDGPARLSQSTSTLPLGTMIGDLLGLPDWGSSSTFGGGPTSSAVAGRTRMAPASAEWSVARRLASRTEPFASGLRRMNATAADLVMRRPPGVTAQSPLGPDIVRHLQWPVASLATEAPVTQAATASVSVFGAPSDHELPFFGGPLLAPAPRAQRAMRVQPLDSPLAPQFQIGTLAAPSPVAGVLSAFGQFASPGAAMSTGQRAITASSRLADETAPVPLEMIPAFAASRARHATWADILAVSAPPPLVAGDPAGTSAIRPIRPSSTIMHRLSFASQQRLTASASGRRPSDLAFGGADRERLLFGPSVGGLIASAQRRGWAAGQAPSIEPQWPTPPAATLPSARLEPSVELRGPSASILGGQPALAEFTRADAFGREPEMGRPLAGPGAGAGVQGVRSFARPFPGMPSAEGDLPFFTGGWPAMASHLVRQQRRAQAQSDQTRVWPPTAARAIDSSSPAASASTSTSTSAPTAASGFIRPAAGIAVDWGPTGLTLPFVRAWRRSIQEAMTPPPTPTLRWPVFRSALPDAVEPGQVQRSVAAEAMAASQGQPLPPLVRRSMEHLFRMDLASVRVHTGTAAARATGAVAARAMAHGSDIYMPGGLSASSRAEDLPLLAHELTHVAQHRGQQPPPAMPSLTLARRAAPEEHDADRIERMVSEAVHEQSSAAREPATELTLARRPAPVTIMRVEEESDPQVSTGPMVSRALGGAAAEKGEAEEKAEQQKDTDKLAEEIFRRLERRLIVERERGGHRW